MKKLLFPVFVCVLPFITFGMCYLLDDIIHPLNYKWELFKDSAQIATNNYYCFKKCEKKVPAMIEFYRICKYIDSANHYFNLMHPKDSAKEGNLILPDSASCDCK